MSDSLRVAAAHRPPYVIYNGSASGSERFTGLLVDLLPALLQYANITTPYEIYNAPDNEGGTLDNDTWNGMPAPFEHTLKSPCRLAATHLLADVKIGHSDCCLG